MPAKDFSIRPGATQHVAYTGTHEQSSAVACTQVYLCATTACHVRFTSAGTAATTSDTYLPALVPVHFNCLPTDIISVVEDTTGGTLYITQGV